MPTKFLTNLLSSPVPVIMEIKNRGGHAEDLLRQRSLSEIVSTYHSVGAPCLSVVTGRWFGGSDAMLQDIARLTSLPLLKKDFITREGQICEAKEMGASAVLLTARILPRSALRRLIASALRQGMTPFVEAVSEQELEAVVHGEECVVAINNKDIRSHERDGGDTERSLALLEPALGTGTRCPVSASGIEDPAVAAGLIRAGFKAVLIGTGLLLADSAQAWIGEFLRHQRASDRACVMERGRC
jgi:indole-3-glycerol phosphate synthase